MSSFDRVATNRHKNNNKRVAKEIVTGKKSKNCDKELNTAGYDKKVVNEHVNSMLRKRMNLSIHEVAEEVVEGKWGEDEICKKLLEEAGYNYNDVMHEVQRLIK